MFDSQTMEITLPADKLGEVVDIAATWKDKKVATRRELQVLAGKFNFVALCILPARRFMSRILTALRKAPSSGYLPIGPEVH